MNIITIFLASVLMISGQVFSEKQKDLGEVNRFKIDFGNPDVVCPGKNYSCEDGSTHFLCTATQRTNPKCICFNELSMPPKMIRIFVRGTNGIRNKVALDYNIANMNIVYWSSELMYVASQYLLECRIGLDPCRSIGEKALKLSQNRILLKSKLNDRWPGRVVRHWFLEIGPGSDWDSLEQRIYKGELTNFTNMVYPLTEFMGCAGTRLTAGFLIVCYYYPAYDVRQFEVDFVIGSPCSSCIYTRPTCSRTFQGLCGVDYEVDMESKALKPSILNKSICYILYMFLFCMFFTI